MSCEHRLLQLWGPLKIYSQNRNQKILQQSKKTSTEIRIAAERLNRLVANLLDMTRIESGMIKPKQDWCDLRDLINVSVKGLEREINESSCYRFMFRTRCRW